LVSTGKTQKRKLQKQNTINYNVSPYIYQMSLVKNYKLKASPVKRNTMKFDNNLAFDLTKKGLTMNKTMEKTAKILE
jgi:hypothetical protein